MKVIVIGAVAAGSKTAAKIKHLSKDTEVTIYTQDTHVSYSACGLPYYIEGNFEDYKNLLIRSPEEFEKSGISVHLKHRVSKINPEEKTVSVINLDSAEEFNDKYDVLVIATGAKPFIPEIENIHIKNVFALRTVEDGIFIREKMRASKNATIIGAGYIGIELLEALIKNGLNVTLINNHKYVMPIFDDDISELIQNYILTSCNNQITLLNDDEAIEFIGTEQVEKVLTKNGKIIPTDMVLISAGVRPVIDIAEKAGIEIGQTGAIKVNSQMQTNIKDIYACGDCIEKINIISQSPMWIPLGSTANKEGRCAGMNICGIPDYFEGVLGSAVTRFLDLTISKTGISEKLARKLGFDPVSEMITEIDRAGYMPDVKKVTIKMTADKRTHIILGAQAIGCGDADKRINSITSGLMERITVWQLASVDITYSPPYSVSIDPVITLAQKLASRLRNP